ncbi:unnamed protein product [Malus baccata var. baccata]
MRMPFENSSVRFLCVVPMDEQAMQRKPWTDKRKVHVSCRTGWLPMITDWHLACLRKWSTSEHVMVVMRTLMCLLVLVDEFPGISVFRLLFNHQILETMQSRINLW